MQNKNAIKGSISFVMTVALLLAITVLILFIFPPENDGFVPTASENIRTVVIDAGHGGMDGGALAPDGTCEKDINLEISTVLSALMRISGYKVVQTRESDVMLDTGDGRGNAKMRDLRKRLEISSAYPDALTVSIHCNKFPQESCHGMQVYYSDSEAAQNAALLVQSSFLKLDSSNHRKIKKADTSIYLLHRAKSPAILVECGFLSNPNELSNLKNESYRKKLALVIFDGVDAAYED
jgi:N-acetylmuramoyl-L-alanine amidase